MEVSYEQYMAAIGIEQLKKINSFSTIRKRIAVKYDNYWSQTLT